MFRIKIWTFIMLKIKRDKLVSPNKRRVTFHCYSIKVLLILSDKFIQIKGNLPFGLKTNGMICVIKTKGGDLITF